MGRLFWKILLGFWLTLIGVSVGVGVVLSLYNESRNTPPDEIASGPRVATLATAAASTLRYGGVPALRALIAEWPRFAQDRLMAVDAEGRDVLGRTVPPAALARARRVMELDPNDLEPPHKNVQWVDAPDRQRYLVFVVARDLLALDARNPSHRRRGGPPVELIALGVLGSLIFSALLAWYLTRPIRSLRGAFERLSRGDLETRVAPAMGRRRDELADLGRDFDRMAERLKQLVSSQRQLLHDVSHELRSPLARLQVAIGLARQQAPADARPTPTLDRIELESRRLDELVGELLTLSRLEANDHAQWDEYFDMTELAEAIVSDARFEANAAGVAIVTEYNGIEREGGDIIVKGRAELMRRAVENVVRNALKVSAAGQSVTLRMELAAQPDVLLLSVLDQGPGVPPDQLQAMFEPFVRLHGSEPGKGFGLGLAIAQRAVAAHRGTIAASNRPEGGLCIAIRLPLAEALPEG